LNDVQEFTVTPSPDPPRIVMRYRVEPIDMYAVIVPLRVLEAEFLL
jgi:hypothetical protein